MPFEIAFCNVWCMRFCIKIMCGHVYVLWMTCTKEFSGTADKQEMQQEWLPQKVICKEELQCKCAVYSFGLCGLFLVITKNLIVLFKDFYIATMNCSNKTTFQALHLRKPCGQWMCLNILIGTGSFVLFYIIII